MDTQALKIPGNEPDAAEWADAVGGFFRNFAVIELLTIEFVTRMADPFKYKSMKKKFLAQRLTWIIDNIHEHTVSDPEKIQELIGILESIREESYFRNVLAHGAAGFAFPAEGAGGSQTLKGVMNFKPEDDTQDAELISMEEIKGRRDEAAALAGKLLASLNGLELTVAAGAESAE
ncbi:MAG: hypothetical protein JWO30_459 [Fibrobacteres bacterium]|nr:hypothetical protein [Fibrobacterota bacterium]